MSATLLVNDFPRKHCVSLNEVLGTHSQILTNAIPVPCHGAWRIRSKGRPPDQKIGARGSLNRSTKFLVGSFEHRADAESSPDCIDPHLALESAREYVGAFPHFAGAVKVLNDSTSKCRHREMGRPRSTRRDENGLKGKIECNSVCSRGALLSTAWRLRSHS